MNIRLEAEAYKSLADLLEQADKTRALFEQARVPLPDALARLVRGNGHTPSGSYSSGPFAPAAPPDAEQEWIWVHKDDATNGTMALSMLRMSPEPLSAREIHAKLVGMGRSVLLGTIANVGTRAYDNRWITRDEQGKWTLVQKDRAAVLYEDHLWGPPDAFQMQELAAYRRAAVLHLLRNNPSGLQQMQLTSLLLKRDLIKPSVPANKDLVKGDLEVLSSQNKVRKMANSKKWVVTE